jgi:inosine-uridine nucleoside N-ribohydrolase
LLVFVHLCDPGIDDAFALAVLAGLGHPPDVVVATGGNVDRDTALRNAACLVAHLGLPSVVARGSAAALGGPFPRRDGTPYGADGLGGATSLLPAYAGEVADAQPLSGDVLATGPLTDVARSLPDGRVAAVTWMGGCLGEPGTATDGAEFNAWADPDAVEAVLRAELPCSVIPLDVTTQVPFDHTDVERLAASGPRAEPFASAGRFLIASRGSRAHVHDAVAAVAHIRPDLFKWLEMALSCDTTGDATRGALRVSDEGRPRSVRVATGVDATSVRASILEGVRAAVG